MKLRDRIAYLVEWALRDEATAMKQAALDDIKAPGILEAVRYQLELREKFARNEGDWRELLAEMISTPPPAAQKGKKT